MLWPGRERDFSNNETPESTAYKVTTDWLNYVKIKDLYFMKDNTRQSGGNLEKRYLQYPKLLVSTILERMPEMSLSSKQKRQKQDIW